MKITALSDVHGHSVRICDPMGADLCIIAGDIAPFRCWSEEEYQRQEQWMRETFCDYVRKFKKTQFVFVAGNHDFWGTKIAPEDSCWPSNAHYLYNSSYRMDNGTVIWGTPLVNPIGSTRSWAFESTAQEQREAFMSIPEDTRIVISHTPPKFGKSMIDVPYRAVEIGSGKPLHLGSTELSKAVKANDNIEYLFCGHIHTGLHTEQKLGNVRCYNVSILNEEYNPSFYPLEICVD